MGIACVLAVLGCRGSFEDGGDGGASGDGTTQGTTTGATGGTGSGATSSGAADPLEACMSCERERCVEAANACLDDPACADCVARPFNLSCGANEDFRRLANCSCFECKAECPHMCPAGANCQSCGVTSCNAETQACSADPACLPCFDDPYGAGCSDHPAFAEFRTCACQQCTQQCLWTCDKAVSECGTCVATECDTEYADCLADPHCQGCTENPLGEGCLDNPLDVALLECVCQSCEPTCGILFQCEILDG